MITVDTSGWTQQQKNMTKAMCVSLLYASGITYDSIDVDLPDIDVINPSGDISSVLTQSTIEAKYTTWKADNDVAVAASIALAAELETERNSSEFKEITLTQIDNAISAISTVAELKEFLRKLCRYIKARGV